MCTSNDEEKQKKNKIRKPSSPGSEVFVWIYRILTSGAVQTMDQCEHQGSSVQANLLKNPHYGSSVHDNTLQNPHHGSSIHGTQHQHSPTR